MVADPEVVELLEEACLGALSLGVEEAFLQDHVHVQDHVRVHVHVHAHVHVQVHAHGQLEVLEKKIRKS